MSSKSKRSTPTKETLRDVARTMQRRAAEPSLSFVVRLPTPGNRRDQGAFDDRVAWSRASARARRRGLH
jgi:hypothetical protein